MKKYKLLKDLPDAEAGTILCYDDDGNYNYCSNSGHVSWYKKEYVENPANSDWFELVTEPSIVPEKIVVTNAYWEKDKYGEKIIVRLGSNLYNEKIKTLNLGFMRSIENVLNDTVVEDKKYTPLSEVVDNFLGKKPLNSFEWTKQAKITKEQNIEIYNLVADIINGTYKERDGYAKVMWSEEGYLAVRYKGKPYETISQEKVDAMMEDTRKELRVTEELLNDRQRLLDAIPECETHGKCVPHALEWIEKMKATLPLQQVQEDKSVEKMAIKFVETDSTLLESTAAKYEDWYYMPFWFQKIKHGIYKTYSINELPERLKEDLLQLRGEPEAKDKPFVCEYKVSVGDTFKGEKVEYVGMEGTAVVIKTKQSKQSPTNLQWWEKLGISFHDNHYWHPDVIGSCQTLDSMMECLNAVRCKRFFNSFRPTEPNLQESKEEKHICKFCGALTSQDDKYCYKNPHGISMNDHAQNHTNQPQPSTTVNDKQEWEIVYFNHVDYGTMFKDAQGYYTHVSNCGRGWCISLEEALKNKNMSIGSVIRKSDNTVFSHLQRDGDGNLITGFKIIDINMIVELDYGSVSKNIIHLTAPSKN